jgi:hypothetical protein
VAQLSHIDFGVARLSGNAGITPSAANNFQLISNPPHQRTQQSHCASAERSFIKLATRRENRAHIAERAELYNMMKRLLAARFRKWVHGLSLPSSCPAQAV